MEENEYVGRLWCMMNGLQEEGEEDMAVSIVHQEEDLVIMWLAGTTIMCDPRKIKPHKLLQALFIVEDQLQGSDLVEVLTDGIRVDGKFIAQDYYPALYKGVPIEQLPLVGHLYT